MNDWKKEYLGRLMNMISDVRAGMEILPESQAREEMALLLEEMERIAEERLGDRKP